MVLSNLTNPEAFLTRDQTAAALTEMGFLVKSKTLATKATRGGGPPYRKFGPRALYRWGDALKWARERLTPPRRSTSEIDGNKALPTQTGQTDENPPTHNK
jgi:hypothetical protein